MHRILPLLILLALLAGCASADTPSPAEAESPEAVRSGAEVLAESGFKTLRGKRVGLIVNHTALVDSVHLIDLMHAAPEVTVAALFGPEHGLRGEADAGEKIDDGRDDRTGAPVYSLYGANRRPTPEMLDGVDVLVFDIQDVGARFYTYISTMGLSMQSAAEAGIPFIVLDRPNPIGGAHASGFVLDPTLSSFVGLYPIPVAHGLTVGELARMIKGKGWLEGLADLDLQVVQAEGWSRGALWPETGLSWIPPSPNIPDFETALVYPGTCFFEATSASEGRGTYEPFKLLGAPWADGAALADTLNARGLAGVQFEAAAFTPRSIEGMSSNPKLLDTDLQGIRLRVTDAEAFRPVATGIHIIHTFHAQAQARGVSDFISRPEWLAKLSGTPRLGEMLASGARPEAIVAAWQAEVSAFDEARTPYLLYD